MTRDEAVLVLKWYQKRAVSIYHNDKEDTEAFDMAIEALKREEKWLDDLANNIPNDTRSRNYETDTEVRLAVTDRHKDKVVLFDAFGEVEYLPTEPMTHKEAWKRIEQTDLISREDAINAFDDGWCYYKKGIRYRLEQVPSAEPTVIRCKDCIHKVLTKDGEYNPEDIVCHYWMSDGLEETDFCSRAERREP